MASNQDGSGRNNKLNSKLVLRGFKADEERPQVEITLIDRHGKTLTSVQVKDDGSFSVPQSAIEKSHRIRIGPAGDAAKEAPSSVYLNYRAGDFTKVMERGAMDIGRSVWLEWLILHRCVSGSVHRCRPSPW